MNKSALAKAPKKPKAIWEAKVPVEKENTVPEVNIFAVVEEVPEVHISVAEVAALSAASVAVMPGIAETGSKTGGKPAEDGG